MVSKKVDSRKLTPLLISRRSVVLVTGATGFLGSHCVKVLLDAGYRVRGTVRSLKNTKKLDPVLALNKEKRLELVEADLTRAETWPGALRGVDCVLHVASPFVLNPDATTIKTAVEGTLNVLRAASHESSVKKIVLTSSCMAIIEGLDWATHFFDEKIWANPKKTPNDYAKSKIFAEKAAWEFHDSLPKESRFALTAINPSFMLGPLITSEQGASATVVKQMLEHAYPAVPALHIAVVDVRDVALAHVRAMETPASDGHRIIVSAYSKWYRDLNDRLGKEFSQQGYSMCVMTAPYPILWLSSFFDTTVKNTLAEVGKECRMDNSKSRTLLRIQYRSVEKALLEMAYSLIERGVVKRTSKYRGLPFDMKL